MAAIIQPRRSFAPVAERPALRLVTADGQRTHVVPVELGLGTAHLVAAVVALVLVLMVALAIGNGTLAGLAPAPAGSAGASKASAPASVASSGRTVTVQAGDSLWTIARRLQPTGDVRSLVDRMVAANGATTLQPGDELIVPA